MSRAHLAAGLAAGLALALATAARAAPPSIPLDEIHAGQRGYGLTVLAGTEPERFEVEVLGVLRNVAPGTSYVLARLTGAHLEKTGVIAGMSGSPVYLDGRLAGAVAFSWPFSQEAIAGITPIDLMRAVPAATDRGAGGGALPTLSQIARGKFDEGLFAAEAGRLATRLGDGGETRVVWSARGFGEGTFDRFGRALARVVPSGGAVAGGRIEPGGSVAALLVDGDLRLAATGTVTEVDGENVLAFGHPFLGLGALELPMATAEVVTVLGSDYSSFKLANTGEVVGAFLADRPAGIAGRLGATARTLPVTFEVAGERPARFALRLARVPEMLPLLVAISELGVLDQAFATAGVQAIDVRARFDLGAHGSLALAQSFDGPGAGTQSALWLIGVTTFLTRSELAALDPLGLELELRPGRAPRATEILGAAPRRPRVRPGETVTVDLETRAFRGDIAHGELEVALPRELPAGRYTILVGSGPEADAARLGLVGADPATIEQALRLLAALHPATDLVVLGVLPARGVAVAGESLPRLPASLQAIWAASPGKSAVPLRAAVAELGGRPWPTPLAGLVRFDVEVVREGEGVREETPR